MTPVAASAPAPAGGVTAAPSPGAGLTRRATLNAGAAVVDYGVRVAVGLALTPILVTGLGRSLFGVWEMLSRMFGYVSAVDGRPTEGLRLVIAQLQSDPDERRKRRYVGAAVAVWALLVPLVLAGGAVLIGLAPRLVGQAPDLRGTLQLTCMILVASIVVTTLATVPESVLRGMNLGYRRLGFQAGITIVGGILAAAAVWLGFGLPGLGVAQLLTAAVAGAVFLVVTRRLVSWMGMDRPERGEIRRLLGMSAWLSLGELVARLVLASDVIILGAVASPALVTTYVLTGYAARSALGVHTLAAGGAMPGVGGLLGGGDRIRTIRVREELIVLTWLFATVIGAAILSWNRSFIGLWVGPGLYGGLGVDALIVVLMMQTGLVRIDAYFIDAALAPARRVKVSVLAAIVAIALAIPMTMAWGMVGLCLGMLIGRLVQSIAYPLLARRLLGPTQGASIDPVRLVMVSAVLLGVAAAIGQRVTVAGWLGWATGTVVTLCAAGWLAFRFGVPVSLRHAVLARVASFRGRGGRP